MTKHKHTVQDIIDRNREISDLLDHIQEYSDDLRDGNVYIKDDNADAFSEIVNEFKQASDIYVSEIQKLQAEINAHSDLYSSDNSSDNSSDYSVDNSVGAEKYKKSHKPKGLEGFKKG